MKRTRILFFEIFFFFFEKNLEVDLGNPDVAKEPGFYFSKFFFFFFEKNLEVDFGNPDNA